MKNLQKILFIFTLIINFNAILSMVVNSSHKKHITFKEPLTTILPYMQYKAEKENPMEWTTRKKSMQAIKDLRLEKNLTHEENNQIVMTRFNLIKKTNKRFLTPQPSFIEKHGPTILAGIVTITTVSTIGFIIYSDFTKSAYNQDQNL